jgi:hypothetical protein
MAAAAAGAPQAGGAPSAPGQAALAARLDRLEARLMEVEGEVAELRHEKLAVEQELEAQKRETAALKEARVPQAASSVSFLSPPGKAPEVDPPPPLPDTYWGAQFGYQGFPFAQRGGGYSYGFYLDHLLLPRGEQSFGDLDVNVGLGVAKSGSEHFDVFSVLLGQTERIEFRQTILSLTPGLKYYFNSLAPWGVRPYIVGGPGIWADIIESPPVFIGQALPSGGFVGRNLPVDAAADVFEGAQGGAGVILSLARTRVPILELMNLGFDYRYTAWTTGQRYNSYALSLSVSQ